MWQRYKVVLVLSSEGSGSSAGAGSDSLPSSAALQSSNCCTVFMSSFVKASPSSLSSAEGGSLIPLIHSSSFCCSSSSLIWEGPGSSWHTPGIHSGCLGSVSSEGGSVVGCLVSAREETETHYTLSTHQGCHCKNSDAMNPHHSGRLPLRSAASEHINFMKGNNCQEWKPQKRPKIKKAFFSCVRPKQSITFLSSGAIQRMWCIWLQKMCCLEPPV